jgi:hypothetical protein
MFNDMFLLSNIPFFSTPLNSMIFYDAKVLLGKKGPKQTKKSSPARWLYDLLRML